MMETRLERLLASSNQDEAAIQRAQQARDTAEEEVLDLLSQDPNEGVQDVHVLTLAEVRANVRAECREQDEEMRSDTDQEREGGRG